MVVAEDERVGLLGLCDLGYSVVVAVFVLDVLLAGSDVTLVNLRQVVRRIYVRGKRVQVEDGGHH